MQFLNDKFFKVAVILFFLLLALPFMFSTPEPKKKDNTPTLEFEDNNPVYNIINRIARFYGFKKDNKNQDFTLTNEQIAQIKKQIAEKKEKQLEQTTKENIASTGTMQKSAAIAQNNDTAKTGANIANNSTAYQSTNTYIELDNEVYEILQDKEGKKYLSNETTLIAMDSLPKSTKTGLQQIALPFDKESKTQDIKDAVSHENTNSATVQNDFKESRDNQSITPTFTGKEQKNYSKGPITSFFKPSTKAGQDFLQNLDSSIKNLQFIKQNKSEQEQTKENQIYTKTYKAKVFNPTTKKMQEISFQQQITPDNIKIAEEIRKITAKEISPNGYTSGRTFKYYGDDIAFPEQEAVNRLPPLAPLHILISEIPPLETEKLNNSFNETFKKAQQKLPDNPKDLPSLEFIDKSNRNKIIKAPNDSFNVRVISRLLADKVKLKNTDDIDFLDFKNCIYVVPEEHLYNQYVSMQIPAILYPELSPENLGQAYESAKSAIDTLLSNKENQLKTEQNQNKAEIEKFLTTQK